MSPFGTSSRRRLIGAQRFRKRRRFQETARLLGIVVVFALFHVWARVAVVQTGYEIRKLMEQREELRGDQHALRVEVASLRSPVRLQEAARELGLKKPPEQQVTLISSLASPVPRIP